jgi:hypothetical protein
VFADYEQRIHQNLDNIPDPAASKVRNFCQQAAKDGHKYAWIDTAGIDKKSSAELSEAINSMYKWYQRSQMCYIYLGDVEKQPSWDATADSIRRARWFTRGWTLQELLAPRELTFCDRDWNFIGTRRKRGSVCSYTDSGFHTPWHCYAGDQPLSVLISTITNINMKIIEVLKKVTDTSVAEKMSWASQRVTTREEDMAYCLLGIFDVNMPLLYGESNKALTRLQVAIMEATDVHSIFAWDYGITGTHGTHDHAWTGNVGSLAQGPAQFRHGHRLERLDYVREELDARTTAPLHYSRTNRGVYITLPVIDLSPMLGGGLLAVLTCMVKETIPTKMRKFKKCVMVIPLYRSRTGADIFHRPGWQTRPLLLDHTAMRKARMQTLYMETPNPRNELQHTNQAEFVTKQPTRTPCSS